MPHPDPPLREQRQDIPILLDHFLARNNARFGTNIEESTPGGALPAQYNWPGNVRELENTVGALVLAERTPSRRRPPRAGARSEGSHSAPPDQRRLSIKEDARVIEDIDPPGAHQDQGNRTRAAEVLEINHRALLKIKDYHIDL